MPKSDYYIESCNEVGVKSFLEWLKSQGFEIIAEQRYFRGEVIVLAHGAFGVQVTRELGMWTIHVSNEPQMGFAGQWFNIEAVVELLNHEKFVQIDPGRGITFLRSHLQDVIKLLASIPFMPTAAKLKQIAVNRDDRVWPRKGPHTFQK
jgi:hypothetical protein